MKIIHNLSNLKRPAKGTIVTVGVFDGVHLGHKKIIKRVVSRARDSGLKSVVLTFDPHPLKVLSPGLEVPSLISLKHRLEMLESLGVDYCIILHFTRKISLLSAETFVKKILSDKLNLKEIYVGENFFFGKGAVASIDALKKLSKRFAFKVVPVRPIKILGKTVSSSLIRDLIIRGDVSRASKFLGRPVSVLGTVVKGARRGRILGFPTANIDPHHEAVPPCGVYAVMVKLDDKVFKGILNIGTRPTFYGHRREPAIEVHIFDFNKKIYGRDIEVIFLKKMRDERKFSDQDLLAAQIKKDALTAQCILSDQ